MPHLFLERHVGHLPDRMYSLISDLATYPKFIPNCSAMVLTPDAGGDANVCLAKMTIRFGPVTQAYTSKVTADPVARTIAAKATDGPFAFLNSEWKIEPEGQGSRICFEIDFKISNPLIAAVAEPAFAKKQDEIISAFVAEADRRFGQ